jgi:hypothetical protein
MERDDSVPQSLKKIISACYASMNIMVFDTVQCKQHIYSTEVKDIDTLTVPVTFAK